MGHTLDLDLGIGMVKINQNFISELVWEICTFVFPKSTLNIILLLETSISFVDHAKQFTQKFRQKCVLDHVKSVI